MIWAIACTLWVCTVWTNAIIAKHSLLGGNLNTVLFILSFILTILSILQETGVI